MTVSPEHKTRWKANVRTRSHLGDLLWTLVNSGLPIFQKKGKLGCKECMDCAETLNTDVKVRYLQKYLHIRCDDALVLEKSARESLDLQIQFLACAV